MRDAPPVKLDKQGNVLARLANLLGCSPETFFTGEGAPAELAQADELMRLWRHLRTDDERQRALAAVRDIARNRP